MRKIAIIISIIVLITIDLISKWFFQSHFEDIPYSPLLGDIFGVQLSYNTGVAFSFPIPSLALKILTVFLIAIICIYFIRTEYPKKSKLLDIGYTFILAGALSHAYERIIKGYVVDFFSLKYFAIFNFADIIITIGALLLFVYYFFYDRTNAKLKSK
ncbi:signal peptidase II [Candidatus Gracilibacteria bacterium]|nr:signal peptidase II [Candidatus Gracilibacteria bacterium]